MKYIREIREPKPEYPCWEHSITHYIEDGETIVRYLVKPYSALMQRWASNIIVSVYSCTTYSMEVDGVEDRLIEAFRENILEQKLKADKELARIQDNHTRLSDIVSYSFYREEKIDKLFE